MHRVLCNTPYNLVARTSLPLPTACTNMNDDRNDKSLIRVEHELAKCKLQNEQLMEQLVQQSEVRSPSPSEGELLQLITSLKSDALVAQEQRDAMIVGLQGICEQKAARVAELEKETSGLRTTHLQAQI